jgi:SAM-dependent methyltransferase
LTEQYYSYRAGEYEEIYHRPDQIRQKELAEIAADLKGVLSSRNVLEIACGTGFWTAVAIEAAERVVAIDISEEMLAVARAKGLPDNRVKFCSCDAFKLDSLEGTFNAGLANFWFSHIPKSRLNKFLCGFHEKLIGGAVVFMADNVYMSGIGGELVVKPECEDTYKLRKLSDGSEYEVLKNYYDESQLCEIFGPVSSELKVKVGDCFWWVNYIVP